AFQLRAAPSAMKRGPLNPTEQSRLRYGVSQRYPQPCCAISALPASASIATVVVCPCFTSNFSSRTTAPAFPEVAVSDGYQPELMNIAYDRGPEPAGQSE